jgi:hypothetical protein
MKIELDAEDQAALRKLNDAQQGMQNFMNTMLTAGETRAAALQQQGREVFEALATKHNLDLKNQSWVPSEDGKSLLLVAQKFSHA